MTSTDELHAWQSQLDTVTALHAKLIELNQSTQTAIVELREICLRSETELVKSRLSLSQDQTRMKQLAQDVKGHDIQYKSLQSQLKKGESQVKKTEYQMTQLRIKIQKEAQEHLATNESLGVKTTGLLQAVANLREAKEYHTAATHACATSISSLKEKVELDKTLTLVTAEVAAHVQVKADHSIRCAMFARKLKMFMLQQVNCKLEDVLEDIRLITQLVELTDINDATDQWRGSVLAMFNTISNKCDRLDETARVQCMAHLATARASLSTKFGPGFQHPQTK